LAGAPETSDLQADRVFAPHRIATPQEHTVQLAPHRVSLSLDNPHGAVTCTGANALVRTRCASTSNKESRDGSTKTKDCDKTDYFCEAANLDETNFFEAFGCEDRDVDCKRQGG
jgi:hypothetical protein